MAKERERKELPALFSACRWLLRCMITAPAPKTLRFYHAPLHESFVDALWYYKDVGPVGVHCLGWPKAFVETMGVDGMGADGLPMQLPLLCWEPAS